MYKIYTNFYRSPCGYVHKFLSRAFSTFGELSEVDKRKWLMRANLTAFLILVSLLQVSASSLAQKVTLKENNVSLLKVFREIRKQTGYDVLVDNTDFKSSKKINANFVDAPLEKVMDLVVQGTGLIYVIEDKTVVIKEKSLLDKVRAYFANIDVTGRVVDEKGEPVAGATIKVKGTSVTAISDGTGFFSLKNISDDAVLQISYLGYQIKEVKASTDLGTLKMEVAVGKLEEVTVNAGYYTVKDSERTGSISRISSKDIETQPVTNVLAVMQGRMAGVNITQTTGVSGGGFDIQIRGRNSIRTEGNAPLYIIDGVPYSSEAIGNSRSTVVLPFTSDPLNSINPADIENIEVLKDADATSIYGSRGANGVILITTKKGKEGKTRYSVDVRQGIGEVNNFMDLLNIKEYLEMRNEAFTNDAIPYGPSDYDVNGTWDKNRYTNWQKEFLGGTAGYSDVVAAMSGGSSKTQFLISSAFHNETTVFPGDFNYTKANVRFNLNHQSEDGRFRINTTAGFTFQKNNQPGTDLTRYIGILAPNAPSLYDQSGNLNWENSTWENPLANLEGKYLTKTNDLIANTLLSYTILPSLTLKGSLGFTNTDYYETRTQPSTMFDPAYQLGSQYSILTANNTDRQSWIIEPQIEWQESFRRLKVQVLVGSTFQKLSGKQIVQEASGFTSNSLIYNLASATSLKAIADNESIYKYQAIFGRINFVFAQRYMLNFTGRRDGSSRFGPNKQFANFGAIGGAWIFHDESRNKENALLNFGKLRVSYGITGNDQIGNYQFLDTYSTTSSNYGGIQGLSPTRLFNANFGWESSKKIETALELGFLKNRIFFTTGWYLNRSSNQLVGIPLPATTGFPNVQSNLEATVQNSGLEFTLKTINVKKDNFNWTTDFNISIAKNKLLSFPNLKGSTYENRLVIGKPLNIIKAYHYTGIDTQTGLYQFEDVNKDGKITSPEDRQTIVDFNPEFFGGLQNQFTWKKWQLDFLLQFTKQRNYSEEYNLGTPGAKGANQTTRVLNRWQNIGDNAQFQRFSTTADGKVLDASDKYFGSEGIISDASFVRLKNVSFSYTFQKDIIKGVRCRISFEGQNLLTFTPYKGSDPEFKIIGYLPPLRIYTANLNLTF